MKTVHVAVGVIEQATHYLLTQRHADKHEGGCWEFPGGKLEPGESPEQALVRELHEELGIRVHRAEPLIEIPFQYPDFTVHLYVQRVVNFSGVPEGREGQALRWCAGAELAAQRLPAANRGILSALTLTRDYLITPEPEGAPEAFLSHLEKRLQAGIRIVQLRAKRMDEAALLGLAREAAALCEHHDATLILNASAELAIAANAHGVHLSCARVEALLARDARLPDGLLAGASCHNVEELMAAQRLGVDYLLCSPLRETSSHPGVKGIGWDAFAGLCAQARVPVYALGGVSPADEARVRASGGHGVAGISAYW
ncbi:Nudix family hydrolase [Acidihalobacter ferrooxydans]|uniref:8-oxo-dGTP diphosphatase n=1 Tax=Acidihalobacter ferrooxydans TaxID=1765967 RepID=A0A1P8UE98_9GAMM|nr:Nudix family hydrolase [Acidihalobacter ferrooxydans]APZ42150.1 hypothetical protein BW247_02780 [Acidihalobacter ferrooxydans]